MNKVIFTFVASSLAVSLYAADFQSTPSPVTAPSTQEHVVPDANADVKSMDDFNASDGVDIRASKTGDQFDNVIVNVRNAIQSSERLAPILSQIEIVNDNGKITLMGSVASEEIKADLEKTVKDVEGVTSVDDEITVQ